MMENMLVTGGCGFIGSNFIRYLLDESDLRVGSSMWIA
jgi:dTDP-glucose 4,6-dehydratase